MHAIRRQAHRAACRNEDGSSSNFNPFARRRARETPSKTENDSRDLSEATVATSNTEDNTGVERDQEVGAPLQAKQEDMPQGNVVNMGPDNTEQTVTTKSLDSYPKGYPNLVAFQSSEPSFSIYRSFSYLHSRVLLHMQDELVELEKELASLDKEAGAFAGPGHIGVNSASRRGVLEQTNDTYQASRRRLLEQMKDKLVDYDENLRQARELALMSERRSAAQNDTFTRWFRSGRSKLLPREDQQHGVPNRAIRTFQQFSSYGIPLYIHNLGRRSSLMAQRLAKAASFAACSLLIFFMVHVPVVSASSTPARRSIDLETPPAYFDASILDYVLTCMMVLYLIGSYYYGQVTRKYALTLSLTSALFWLAMVSEDDTRFTTSYRWNTLKIWLGTAFVFGCLSCQAYVEDAIDDLPTFSPSSVAVRRQSVLYRFLLQLFAVSSLLQVTGMALQSFRNGCFLNALPPCLTLGILITSNIPQRHPPTLYVDTEAASRPHPNPSAVLEASSNSATSAPPLRNVTNLPSPSTFDLFDRRGETNAPVPSGA